MTLAQFRVIVLALAGGIFLFGTVAAYVSAQGLVGQDVQAGADGGSTSLEGPLLIVLLAMIPAQFAAWFAVRRSLAPRIEAERAALREAGPGASAGQIPPSWATQTLISAALAEGTALFAGVVHLLTGSVPALAVMAVGLCAVLLHYPNEARAMGRRDP